MQMRSDLLAKTSLSATNTDEVSETESEFLEGDKMTESESETARELNSKRY